MVFTVEGGGALGKARVGVDYSAFAEALGGNYASRLRLVSLPACASTTPEVAACQVQTPLVTDRDAAGKAVSAEVDLGAAIAASAPLVLAATGTDGGDGGDAGSYSASTLSPSGSWTAGGSSGSFTYAYPLAAPGATTTVVPQLNLVYNSAVVDGKTASTQAQASWVGDGWSTPDSFVEQTFVSCSDDPEGSASPKSTGDQCYAGPVLTLSLGGSSTSLVWDADKKTFTPGNDDGSKVEYVTGSNNGTGTYNTDYWTVTDRSGTVYYFGRNQLPGWSAGKPVTNSVDSMPVYSAHPGDPCHNASGFDASVCTMAYKWHLDYVKDVRGDAMSYYYTQDTNYYGQNKGGSNTKYVRDSYLSRIDYGFKDGGAFGTVPDQVSFTTGSRCVAATCDPISAANNATMYPDVPFDLICDQGATCTPKSPSMFSTVRLKQITTKQYDTASSQYRTIDTYDLAQTEPPTGDGTSPTLWLSSITRTASDTSAGGSGTVPMPPVKFAGTTMKNRVDTADYPGMYRYRLTSITTELGAVTGITYGLPNPCTAAYVASADPSSNTNSCYPVRWTPKFYTAPITDWFQKYAVTQVLEADATGGALQKATTYEYGGGAAWHYDDNEVVKAKDRTWGQFRGYATATVRTGDGANNPRTKRTTAYYRGMDGDYLTATSTRSVTVTDSQGGLHTDSDRLSGSELEATSFKGDGGNVDGSAITSYWVSPATATRSRTGLPALTANLVRPVEVLARQAVGSGWRYTETDSSYNATVGDPDFGLATATYTHTVPVDPAYDSCATTTYAPANTAKNLVGLVASRETDSVACSGYIAGAPASVPGSVNTLGAPSSVNRPAQVVSATRTFYDDSTYATTFPQTTAPTTGNATMGQQASDHTGGSFTWQTVERQTYDGYGRPLVAYDANGNATTTAYTTNSVGLTTGRSVTNAKNQKSSSTLAPARGLKLTATDANGVLTTARYDALGRPVALWRNSRPTSGPADTLYAYTLSQSGVSGTTAQSLNDSLGYVTSYTMYDSLGRQRQTQAPTPRDGRLITESFYDSHGWVWKTNNTYWDPDHAPSLSVASVPQDSKIPDQVVTTFDGLGRTLITTSYQYAQAKEVTTTVHGGDRTTVVPPAGGTVKTTVVDPLGRTVEVDDYSVRPTVNAPANTFTGDFTISGGTSQAITYGFDGHRRQNTVTADGSTWTTTYNLLGQVTSRNDPDAGTTTNQYDAVGNLVQTTDARGKSVSTTYDALNRRTGTYAATLAAKSTANRLASWVYDNDNNVAGVTNAIGHPTTITSYDGGQPYVTQASGFTVMGKSLGETITIPSATEGTQLGKSYIFTHDYTAVKGLPYSDTSPAGGGLPLEKVTRTYATAFDLPNGLGAVGDIGYAQGTSYDAYGRVEQSTLGAGGNLAYITNTYDPHTGRLTDQLVSRSNTGTPSDVDKQHYDYDPAGNITRQTSTRMGTTTETQCYRYDQLDRLTQAWTATDSCAAAPTPLSRSQVGDAIAGGAYWTEWSFDLLGNRTSQTEHSTTGGADTTTAYTYNGNGSNQAHTLTSAGNGSTFAYDTTGNTVQRTTPATGAQTLTWDDARRLTKVAGPTGETKYVYDADGQVLLQKNPGSTTLYLPGEQITLTGSTTSGVRYLPLPGGGTAVRTGAGVDYKFEITDPHGTATLGLDSTAQTPTWRQFTPYGAARGTAATWFDNRGFLNKPHDTSTGLTTLGVRQYDPLTGRFISLDPLFEGAESQQIGGYSYAASNPLSRSDPSGLYGSWCTTLSCVEQTGGTNTPATSTPTPAPSGNGTQAPTSSTSRSQSGSGSGSGSTTKQASYPHGKTDTSRPDTAHCVTYECVGLEEGTTQPTTFYDLSPAQIKELCKKIQAFCGEGVPIMSTTKVGDATADMSQGSLVGQSIAGETFSIEVTFDKENSFEHNYEIGTSFGADIRMIQAEISGTGSFGWGSSNSRGQTRTLAVKAGEDQNDQQVVMVQMKQTTTRTESITYGAYTVVNTYRTTEVVGEKLAILPSTAGMKLEPAPSYKLLR
ncbi:RHS repeat-associated core domain-containing protein [Kitasatospora purpeofusca]|uniref:RHS repeat domain-containing protein n=1 Tax=Kitasatospora purpeofusca TaxID=67352 RepID=UPI0036D3D52C